MRVIKGLCYIGIFALLALILSGLISYTFEIDFGFLKGAALMVITSILGGLVTLRD